MRPGDQVNLAAIDTGGHAGAPGGKQETEDGFGALTDRLAGLQERLWAERRQSLLIVLQAMDAGGKDGTIKHLFRALNAAGSRVASFKAPTEDELAHDFLWRVHKVVPGRGEVVVFNRSHYEDVLIVRVHDLVPEKVWRPRYKHIVHFEEALAAGGAHIVKLFLHISAKEQAKRFRDRLDDPTKRWKFRLGDLEERKRWDEYQAAYAEALARTSTAAAPWYVIPADHKWYRDWAVSQIVIETLQDMAPQYPPLTEDLEGVEIV